jgi:hypothetical protein
MAWSSTQWITALVVLAVFIILIIVAASMGMFGSMFDGFFGTIG